MSEPKQTIHHPTQTFTDGTPIAAPFGGTYGAPDWLLKEIRRGETSLACCDAKDCSVCDDTRGQISAYREALTKYLSHLPEIPEPANPEGLTKPTQAEREALKSGRLPDLMHLLAKVAKVERSLTRGYNVRMQDNASAAALRRLVNQAVRDCAAAIVAALAMHPGRSQQ